jgi:hypothetical protein
MEGFNEDQRQVCQSQIVSTEGFTPRVCASCVSDSATGRPLAVSKPMLCRKHKAHLLFLQFCEIDDRLNQSN